VRRLTIPRSSSSARHASLSLKRTPKRARNVAP
jgi:hypothetical protein